jgi:hypothetical protein
MSGWYLLVWVMGLEAPAGKDGLVGLFLLMLRGMIETRVDV